MRPYTRGRFVAFSPSSSARAAPDRRRAAVKNGTSPHRIPKSPPIPCPPPGAGAVQRPCLACGPTDQAGGQSTGFPAKDPAFSRKGERFSPASRFACVLARDARKSVSCCAPGGPATVRARKKMRGRVRIGTRPHGLRPAGETLPELRIVELRVVVDGPLLPVSLAVRLHGALRMQLDGGVYGSTRAVRLRVHQRSGAGGACTHQQKCRTHCNEQFARLHWKTPRKSSSRTARDRASTVGNTPGSGAATEWIWLAARRSGVGGNELRAPPTCAHPVPAGAAPPARP